MSVVCNPDVRRGPHATTGLSSADGIRHKPTPDGPVFRSSSPAAHGPTCPQPETLSMAQNPGTQPFRLPSAIACFSSCSTCSPPSNADHFPCKPMTYT